MRKGTLHLASQDISVVDDVDDELVEDDVESESVEIDWNPKATDLGDGYVEINGYVFYENWDEIDPPGSDDEPEIPHEEVMAYVADLLKKRRARR